MALTAQEMEKAKQEAIRYLEYSTYTICLALGVDPATASSSMSIPVSEDHNHHMAYVCLVAQLGILEGLVG